MYQVLSSLVHVVQEGISTIITAIQNSHKIFRRLETYIIYRIASSLLILGYFFFAILIFDFEMPTWVLVLINLLNDVSAMATSLDKVSMQRARNMFLLHVTSEVQQHIWCKQLPIFKLGCVIARVGF